MEQSVTEAESVLFPPLSLNISRKQNIVGLERAASFLGRGK